MSHKQSTSQLRRACYQHMPLAPPLGQKAKENEAAATTCTMQTMLYTLSPIQPWHKLSAEQLHASAPAHSSTAGSKLSHTV
jgi:hypothetical protein